MDDSRVATSTFNKGTDLDLSRETTRQSKEVNFGLSYFIVIHGQTKAHVSPEKGVRSVDPGKLHKSWHLSYDMKDQKHFSRGKKKRKKKKDEFLWYRTL